MNNREATMRVLIADDDAVSRILLRKTLSTWGYEVIAVNDGAQAWEQLIAPDAPLLAVLDWMMPQLTGPDVCRRARDPQYNLRTYIILLTARTDQRDIVEGLDAGANDYIRKPFDLGELQARIRVGQRVIELESALAAHVRELEDALAHVRTLQGLIPICSRCHKIRDDAQVWQDLGLYIEQHSDAHLSHGLCPDCVRKEISALEEGREFT